MKKIIIYYGPKNGFEKIISKERKTLSELVHEDSIKRNTFTHKFKRDDEDEDEEKLDIPQKEYISNLVAYSESYAGITESAVQSFASMLSAYVIDNLYLQNPPIQIRKQLEQAFPDQIVEKKYDYKKLSKKMFFKINDTFSENIIGQETVRERLLVSLYPLMDISTKIKPIVMMFYGNSGIGKTETAKFISSILGQPLFRKQFSMFHSSEFQGYLFGGSHSQSSFAKDLLERESNVILLDEFDKPHSLFHSAFYQMFDEGVFEDKNYHVELYNSIIICTSNYQSEADIRKNLGEPIFFRFDKFIKFENLSEEALRKITNRLIEIQYNSLTKKEQLIVNKGYIQSRLLENIGKLSNVRQISTIVEEYFGIQLVSQLISKHKKEEQNNDQ
jgi:ATP-dependent Clp protease ATP-binding subunit ClpA